jgi:flagellar protein FlgJ
MTSIGPLGTAAGGATPAATRRDEQSRLRDAAHQLEGVFVEQLFKAMRETVPQDGLTNGGAGEDIFTGLLDQKMAAAAPSQWAHGIGESLARQLAPRLASHSTSPANAATDVNDVATRAAALSTKAQ